MIIESHILSQVGQLYLTFGITNVMVVRGLNGFWPSAFSDASLQVKECASEWEQEVCELGLGAWALAEPWLRQEHSMGVWLGCCQDPLPLRVLIKTDMGRDSAADSAKGVNQRVLAIRQKKKKKARVGNSAAQAVSKCCPASSLAPVCSALLPLPASPRVSCSKRAHHRAAGLQKSDSFANNNFDF